MGVAWILRAGCVEVAVGLLCRADDIDDGIDIVAQPLVWIGLKEIAGTLDGLVGVGVVERIAYAIHLEHLRRILQVRCGILKVLVAAFALALGERQGNSDITAGLQALAPERVRDFHTRERYLGDGIARCRGFLLLRCRRHESTHQQNEKDESLHKVDFR